MSSQSTIAKIFVNGEQQNSCECATYTSNNSQILHSQGIFCIFDSSKILQIIAWSITVDSVTGLVPARAMGGAALARGKGCGKIGILEMHMHRTHRHRFGASSLWPLPIRGQQRTQKKAQRENPLQWKKMPGSTLAFLKCASFHRHMLLSLLISNIQEETQLVT